LRDDRAVQVALAVGLAAVALLVAWLIQRRTAGGGAPVRTGYHVPHQVTRSDFTRPDAPWLVAVFTSGTCGSCADVWTKARELECDAVAVAEVEFVAERALHDRYGIDGVPTVVVADADGAVQASFLGPVSATDLWATLAELREPGSVPDGCDHHGSAAAG
jgi:hypothetical protein